MNDAVIERDHAWASGELQKLLTDTALVPDPFPLYRWLRENDPLPALRS